MVQIDSTLSFIIDSTLGLRCRSVISTAQSSVLLRASTSVVAHVLRMCTRKKDVEGFSCRFEVYQDFYL